MEQFGGLLEYDVVVIGGGPIGLATAYECAKAKKKVVLLEKSLFFNQSGSSGDLVRMFRTAYTEDFMADLAHECMGLWDELEKDAGEPLRLMHGLLNFGDPKYGEGGPEGTLEGPIENLKRLGMKYTELNSEQIEAKHPFQNLPSSWKALEMPDNGVINVSLLTRTLYRLCKDLGVHLVQYAEATQIKPDPRKHAGAAWVIEGRLGSDKGTSFSPIPFSVGAQKIAITSGAFTNHVLYPSFNFTLDLDIWEMTWAYYAIDEKVKFPMMWFQFAEDTKIERSGHTPRTISNLFYGFPSVPWGPPNLARISVDAATNVIKDPNDRAYSKISPEDLGNARNFCINHVRGVGPDPVPVLAGQCLQTNVYDNMFVLDYIPDSLTKVNPNLSNSIAVFTAGWAMKFVPLLGKVLKEMLVDGSTQYDISHFKMDRSDKDHTIIQHGPVKKDASLCSHPAASSLRR